MPIDQSDLQTIANLIVKNIEKDFEIKHMSKNLVNTMYVTEEEGEIKIHIPAKTYDMLLFKSKGVVLHNGKGSYASGLNDFGSSYGNHKRYVDYAIEKALEEWRSLVKENYEMTIMK